MAQEVFFKDSTPGSLSNMVEIQILICCMLREADEPLEREQINDVFQANETVNYFNFCQALHELKNNRQVLEFCDDDKVKRLHLTELGKGTAANLADSLPPATLERNLRLLKTQLDEKQQSRGRKISISKTDDGYLVRLIIEDVGSDLMDLTLFAPNKDQAERIAKELRGKTTDVYRCILSLLYNDAAAVARIADDMMNAAPEF